MADARTRDDGWQAEAEQAVREVLTEFNAGLLDWPADDDLISSRQLDSLIFMSVLVALEESSGREIDPAGVPTAELRTIRGLARIFYGPHEGVGTVDVR